MEKAAPTTASFTDETAKKRWQVVRKKRRDLAASRLAATSVRHRSLNNGAYIVIEDYGVSIDFWPGSGLWIVRGKTERKHGIWKLIRFIAEKRMTHTHFEISSLKEFSRVINAKSRMEIRNGMAVIYTDDFLSRWYDVGISVQDAWDEIKSMQE